MTNERREGYPKIHPMLIGALVAAVTLGIVVLGFASMRVSRDIDNSAATTGSSTMPKDPGSNMDRTKRTNESPEPMQKTNVPPVK
jgi:hypothetical protein